MLIDNQKSKASHQPVLKVKAVILVLLTVSMLLLLSACVPGDGTATISKPAGFFSGVWHGWVSPISLVIGLFKHNIRIYEVNNTGWWYDLGYYMAIISGFGGLSLSRRRKLNRECRDRRDPQQY